MYAFVGCYTTADRNGHGTGINTYQMNSATGVWEHRGAIEGITNPSFLARHPNGKLLYCVHGGSGQGVSAFAIDPENGALKYLNTQPSGGANPVHLSIHPSGTCLVVANYTGGTVALLPIAADGTVGPPTSNLALTGEPGPDPVEQPGPHPHDIPLDPSGQFAVVPDKGLDRVFVFRVDTRAEITELQVITSLPADYKERSTGAEIAVAPPGNFVYASNRGHDSIVIFAVDPNYGRLTTVGWEPTQGSQPRHFALDPSGSFLYAANQASDSITTFVVDQTSGTLKFTGQVVRTGSPVSIVFAND